MLHLSDLSGDEDSTDLLIKREDSDVYQNKVRSLRAEMDHLKAEVSSVSSRGGIHNPPPAQGEDYGQMDHGAFE